MKLSNYLSLIQGWYFFLTGSWPLVHYNSFAFITGPKEDVWLVKTVGAIVIAIGISILTARKSLNFPVVLLAATSAAGLAIIDIVYVLNGTIRWIYLIDAFAEIIFVFAWLYIYYINVKNEQSKQQPG